MEFPFRSAYLKIVMDGMSKGEADVWVKGDKMARKEKRVTTMFGMSQTQESLTITLPDKIITHDPATGSAQWTTNPGKLMQDEYEKLSRKEQKIVQKNAEKLGNVFMQGLGMGQPEIKQGELHGHPVDIVTIMGMTNYTIRGTPLTVKVEGNVMGVPMKEEATEFKTNIKVSDSVFELPKGVVPVHNVQADSIARNVALGTFNMLKDPNMEENMKKRMNQAGAGGPMGPGARTGSPAGPGGQPGQGPPPDLGEAMKAFEQLFQNQKDQQPQ